MNRIYPLDGDIREDHEMYELLPAHTLPVVELSVSIRSRFLLPFCLKRLDFCIRQRTVIFISWFIGAITMATMGAIDNEIGQVTSFVGSVLGLPAGLAGIVVLRYNIVRLYFYTYAFWFFSFVTTSTFLVLGFQLGDLRASLMMTMWFCLLPNIFVDAGLRALKLTTTMIALATIVVASLMCTLRLQLSKDIRNFDLIRYGSHALLADMYVTNGLMTTVMILLRNVYRKRHLYRKHANRVVVECVSYRCMLRMSHGSKARSLYPLVLSEDGQSPSSRDRPVYMQRLRCGQVPKQIDTRRAIFPLLVRTVHEFPRPYRRVLRAIMTAAVTLSVIAAPLDLHGCLSSERSQVFPYFQVVSLGATIVFTCSSFALYQREVFAALLTSFDFVYLSVQISIVHLGLCDFFQWSGPCLAVLVSWLWIHWVLCVDALAPPVRRTLDLPIRFAAVVFSFSFASSFVVVYILLFADTPVSKHDRILFHADIWGNHLEIRLVPIFYNCLATLHPWFIRLLYRLWTSEQDVLVLLDGPIVYENYFRIASIRLRSRTWAEATRSVVTSAGTAFVEQQSHS